MRRKYIMVGLLLLASVGLSLASYLWAIQIDTPEERLAYSLKHSEKAFQQYFNADYDSAKQTILTHIKLLERFSAESKNPVRNPFVTDAMLWYIRLVKLEENSNHNDEKANYMQEALSRCQKVGFTMNCSEEYLRQQVERMDGIYLGSKKDAPN